MTKETFLEFLKGCSEKIPEVSRWTRLAPIERMAIGFLAFLDEVLPNHDVVLFVETMHGKIREDQDCGNR
jgi:hypothetical protein